MHRIRHIRRSIRMPQAALAGAAAWLYATAAPAALLPAPLAIGWDWWLPPNFSEHGVAIDSLFNWIFWITAVVFVGVQVTLVVFLIRFRHRPNQTKAAFIHGNTRLEIIWTVIPAIILIALSVVAKTVWENYRYGTSIDESHAAKLLVIAQQFNWNVVYPGPDGKLGRYLIFPKTTDVSWPVVPAGREFHFPQVAGPAYLPEEKSRKVLNDYIDTINPLGKDFSDSNGTDDDWENALARPVEIPKGRPVIVVLASKDVIHDFYLPNFRVKLDAVPGMMGKLYFTATRSSAEFEKPTLAKYSLEQMSQMVSPPRNEEWQIVIDDKSGPEAYHDTKHGHDDWLYRKPGKRGATIIRNGSLISAKSDDGSTVFDDLKAIGVNEVTAFQPKYWDLVCEELCGMGHYTMKDKLIVLEPEEYRRKYEPDATAVPSKTVAMEAH